MIKLRGISIGYKNKIVLSNFDYRFKNNGLYAIIGKSGCGKTTLLNSIGGILPLLEGEILFSKDIQKIFDTSVYIFQENNLFDRITVVENIRICMEIAGKQFDSLEAEEILEKLGILEYKDTRVGNLSGGERQRVSIAIAILRKAKVILADEPNSNLDDANSRYVLNILKKISKESLVIFTSHNTALVEEYADYIINLENPVFDSVEEENISVYPADRTRKKIHLRSIIYLYRKIMRSRKIHLFFIYLIFSVLIISLALSLALSNYSREKAFAKYMVDNRITEAQIIRITSTPITSFSKENYNFSFEKRINISFIASDFPSYVPQPDNDYYRKDIFNYYILDENLGINEVRVTDYSLLALKYYGILDFEKVEDCVGMKLQIINNDVATSPLTIKEVILTDFSEIEKTQQKYVYGMSGFGTHEELQYFITNIWGNKETFYYLCNPCSDSAVYVNNVYCIKDSNKILNENEIILSDRAVKEMDVVIHVGQNITLTIANSKGVSLEYKFVVKEIMDTSMIDYDIWFSSIMLEKINFDIYMQEAFDFSSYYVHDFTSNQSELARLVRQVEKGGFLLQFKGRDNIDYLVQDVKNNKRTAITMFLLCLALAILVISYCIYTSFSENIITFNILEIYGMKRINELMLLSINYLFIIFLAGLTSCLPIYFLHQAYDNLLKIAWEVDYFPPTYEFIFTIFAVLISYVISFGTLIIGFIFTLKRKARSHIENR